MFFLNGDLEQFAIEITIKNYRMGITCTPCFISRLYIPASLDYAKNMTVRVRTLQAELQMLLLLFVRV